jgi:tRNA(Ile)-lysidine synthase TilS/MesJ
VIMYQCLCMTGLGTDSTVLAYLMKKLNAQYGYGLDLFLLSVDEGIAGYRDDSLEVGAVGAYTAT